MDTIVKKYGFDLYQATGNVRSYVCRVVGRGSISLHVKTTTGEWVWRGPHLGDKVEGLGADSLQAHLEAMVG